MAEPKKKSKARPPTPTPESIARNPFFGQPINKVIQLNIEQEVLKLHDQGMGVIRMAKFLTKEVLPDGQTIGSTSIQRYLEKQGLTNVPKKDFAINVYAQQRIMLDTVNDLMENTAAMIEALNEDVVDGKEANIKDFQALITTQEKLIARASLLTSSIGAMQEKVYNYQAVNTIVTKVLNFVQQADVDLFVDIKDKISKDPMLAEAFRRILPDNVKQ